MDRKKRNWAIAAAAAVAIAGAGYYSARPEEAPKAKAREKTVEEQRVEELVNLMSAGSGGGGDTAQAPPAMDLPPMAAPVPMPEGEAFDMDAAARSYRRSAETADAADYYNCDGDCTGLGAGMTMDGSEAPTLGEGFGRTAPLPEARPLPEPGPLDPGPE